MIVNFLFVKVSVFVLVGEILGYYLVFVQTYLKFQVNYFPHCENFSNLSIFELFLLIMLCNFGYVGCLACYNFEMLKLLIETSISK